MPLAGFYFFLSYARREDREDAFVGQFYADLLTELRARQADCESQPAFRDLERIRMGADWEKVLGDAVGSCRAFVALCSPGYVNSPYCGKEWAVFQDRLTRFRGETDIDAPALIPVRWLPFRGALPPEMSRYQYTERGMDPQMREEYAERGLMHIMRTDPAGALYRAVVSTVADAVRRAAERYGLPQVSPDLRIVRSAFQGYQVGELIGNATGTVRVFVAAGTASAPPEGRNNSQYYGRSPYDWTPYHPPVHPTAAFRAQQVINDSRCLAHLDEVGHDLLRKLEEGMRNRETSVLLIDAWTARGEPYRTALAAFDRHNHPVTGVLVPCHETDEESHADTLWQDLSRVFQRNWMRRNDAWDPLFRVQVDKGHFDDKLSVMVTVAQNRLAETADPVVLPEGPVAPPLPALGVPARPPTGTGGPDDPPEASPTEGPDDDR
ncbi:MULTISPECIES: FxsC protein [Streptomyces]|uniref:FxsC protein n=1 Tax=Streptomyces pseudovenezuelae TaxID=67350 RepID=A0A101N4G6_9ACTN|nr:MULTISPECIES: FxsC protein [Streptomyces]KUM86335.1 FxsC protein [Streptomyces pseudovenezuelae]